MINNENGKKVIFFNTRKCPLQGHLVSKSCPRFPRGQPRGVGEWSQGDLTEKKICDGRTDSRQVEIVI